MPPLCALIDHLETKGANEIKNLKFGSWYMKGLAAHPATPK
jgi:hypothetical protein